MNRTIGTPRLWAILASVAGLVSLGVTIAFRLLEPVRTAGQCMADGAVLAFEFALKAQELTNIFGEPGDPCRPLTINAVDAINQLDVIAYIPSYSLFAIFAALFIAGGKLRLPIWRRSAWNSRRAAGSSDFCCWPRPSACWPAGATSAT
jgi:hypothetical protein